jgi:RNA polymerase sigma-70 factor, ECF subfamily
MELRERMERMEHWICVTCGTQFAPSQEQPASCPICLDQRQYVGQQGQQWTRLAAMTQGDFQKHDELADRFEAERSHLRGVAYRILGSLSDADDAVQECWLRLSRADTSRIENLGAWLTTVIGRVCCDMLRARPARREESLGDDAPAPGAREKDARDPEEETLLADAVGLALLVVLARLNPAERLAFVLHDLFDVPFEAIAPIVNRSPTAARQLASRARRRVQGTGAVPDADLAPQRTVVDAFLAASRAGDFDALLTLLDPEVIFRADRTAVAVGSSEEIGGAVSVARHFLGRAQGARPVLVNGAVGAIVAPHGRLFLTLQFTIKEGKITEIDVIADPEHLRQLKLALLPPGS